MKYLEEINEHPRDKNLSFIEDTHTYYYKDKIFYSVTTYISKLFNEFNKDLCIQNMMKSKNWSSHELYGKTKEEISEIWSNRNKDAIKEGIQLHNDIEDYLNNIAIENSSIEFQYFQKFLNEHQLKVFRTEWKIYDESLKLAGTIDMCSIHSNGTITIYDWKRSKSIIKSKNYPTYSNQKELSYIEDTNFNHYALQLNLYKYILEKKYNYKVNGMYLVCLHPENKNKDYLLYNVPIMKKEIDFIIKFIEKNN